MVNIEINGIPLQAREGAMVIEVADQAGIVIPRFCYHEKLSVAANCRMCLVEVEKAPKTLPACATPVMEGMKVYTHSPKALASQKSVMEFLLINHPLDCPICDQGGECPLQETAMGFGKDVSRFSEGKRVVLNKDLGPLVATDMTRCILCTRCVRFGVEIGGVPELGATGRGEHTEIGTYVEHALESEVAGNIIDLCPVGALTSKPYRYSARPWELQHNPSVSPHDGVGANIEVHTRRGQVMRVIAADNEEVNECWIADRDRFSYQGVNSEQRLTGPKIKQDGVWRDCDWSTALEATAAALKGVSAGERLGAMVSPSATLEEMYLLQKLMRGLGSNNIDHRLRQSDFSDTDKSPPFPWLGQSLQELEQSDAVLLIGSHVRREQPLVGVRLRKAAVKHGAKICFVNPVDYPFNFPVHEQLVSGPAAMVRDLAAIAKVLKGLSAKRAPGGMAPKWEGLEPDPRHQAIAKALFEGKQPSVLLGALAIGHPAYASVRALATQIAKMSLARFGYLSEGGNAAGAWLAGAVPQRQAGNRAAEEVGKDWRDMLHSGLDACVLLGVEPELDCADPGFAVAGLKRTGFVVSLTAFDSPGTREVADVMLPMGTFTETSGTLVNMEGRWQSFRGASTPVGESRPGWKILRVLGNMTGVEGFEQFSSEQVRDEAKEAIGEVKADNSLSWQCPESLELEAGLWRVGEVPIYSVDALVRRAEALQQTPEGRSPVVAAVNRATAERLGLTDAESVEVVQGKARAVLPLAIDERVADDTVCLPAGVAECSALGNAFGKIELRAASAAETEPAAAVG